MIDNENNRFRNKYPVFQTPLFVFLCAASQGPKPHQSNIICESGLVCFCIGCLVLSSVNQLLLQNKSFNLGKQYCACLLKSQLVQRQSALPTNKSRKCLKSKSISKHETKSEMTCSQFESFYFLEKSSSYSEEHWVQFQTQLQTHSTSNTRRDFQ